MSREPATSMSTEEQSGFITNNMNGFVGWLLFHINSVGTNGQQQMFYVTLTNTYYGLSRDGIDLLYRYGYGVSLDVYDNLRTVCRQKSLQEST